MKHNINIPGWNGQEILDILGDCAANIRDDGAILELGALFGRSTYTLGHNKKDSVTLTTIDIWPTVLPENHLSVNYHDGECGEEELALLKSKLKNGRLEGGDFYELWKEYTKGIINNTSIRDYTTIPNSDFPMFDFIYHDADHTYERVYGDLTHWLPKLKPNGFIIVDDYEATHFPGVVLAVDQFAAENNFKLRMVTPRNAFLRRI